MKKIIALVLVMVMCFSLGIGATVAYLTDRETETNVFTVGNVDIELTEDFEQGSQLIPGVDVEKEVEVVNTGSNDAWVWVTISIPSALDNIDDASKNALHFNYGDGSIEVGKWTWMDETKTLTDREDKWMIDTEEIDGVKYNRYTVLYQTALKPGATTESVIKKVYLDTRVDIDDEGNWYLVDKGEENPIYWNTNTDGNPKMLVAAYAIQTENFENVYEAYKAYIGQWGGLNAKYTSMWNGVIPTEMPETLVVDGDTQTVHVKDAAAFVYLSTLSDEWRSLYTDGKGSEYSNYFNGEGAKYYYSGQWTISLEADIDLGNNPIDPVVIVLGENCGYSTFDGNNHTISNINATTGLFADGNRASYSNLTLENVTATRGALAGSPRSSITNVTVKNATISGENYVGGLVGSAYSSVTNCKVENSSVTATGKEAGGLIGYIETTAEGTPAEVRNNTVSNVSVYANNRAAGLVAQVNKRVKVYNNTIDTVTVGAADTSEYHVDAVISNCITAPENVHDNTVINFNEVVKVSTAGELIEALEAGKTNVVINAEGANIGALNSALSTTNVPAGTTVTIANAVVEGRSYGNGVDGTVIFENCTFTNTGAYSIHFDKGSGNVVFNNCTMDGWCSFGKAIKSVEMNDCTFTGNGTYALIRFYQDVTITNCTFDCSNADVTDNEYYPEGIDMVEGYTATVINCTNVNGDMKDLFSEHDLDGTDGIVIFK